MFLTPDESRRYGRVLAWIGLVDRRSEMFELLEAGVPPAQLPDGLAALFVEAEAAMGYRAGRG